MGDVVKMFHGRVSRGQAIPKPVMCKECEEPIEAARLQALGGSADRCISCARAWEKRFERQMQGVRDFQAVRVIR